MKNIGGIVNAGCLSNQDVLEGCSYVKSFLMLIIVLYHSMAIFMKEGWGPYLPAKDSNFFAIVADWLNTFHIYAFTMISGYIFCYVRFERGGYSAFCTFIKNKVKRLLIPYMFITVFWLIPVYCFFNGINIKEIFINYVLGTAPNQLWFLLMLFWVFIIMWGMSTFCQEHQWLGLAIVIIIYIYQHFGYTLNYFCFARALKYLLFFYIGFLLRKDNNARIMNIHPLYFLTVDFILYTMRCYLESENVRGVVPFIVNSVLYIVGSLMAFSILSRIVKNMHGKLISKIIDYLSIHSMTIFLVHQQFIYFSIMVLNGRVESVTMVNINFGFALSMSILFSILMRKNEATKILIGEK